jgi:hypothetical protein
MTLRAPSVQRFCVVEDFWFAPVIGARIALGRQLAWAMGFLRGLG